MRSYDATPKLRSSHLLNALWATTALLTTLLVAGLVAKEAPARDRDRGGNEIPLSVAEIYFELNDTDGDLGIHALIDGEPWKTLQMLDPREREMLDIKVRSRLRRQGLTELFFESAEPPFDELAPERFFRRFPEGEYEVEAKTLDGQELEGETMVTHLIPAPPIVSVNGRELPEDCDEDPVPAFSEPLVLSWEPVTMSHPDLGRMSEPIDVVAYQVVVEREEGKPLKLTFDLSGDVSEVELPPGLFNPGDMLKGEVLVREASHNQTATETCFDIAG